jgi:hypothetical protein
MGLDSIVQGWFIWSRPHLPGESTIPLAVIMTAQTHALDEHRGEAVINVEMIGLLDRRYGTPVSTGQICRLFVWETAEGGWSH